MGKVEGIMTSCECVSVFSLNEGRHSVWNAYPGRIVPDDDHLLVQLVPAIYCVNPRNKSRQTFETDHASADHI
jgi:hypothetical protein